MEYGMEWNEIMRGRNGMEWNHEGRNGMKLIIRFFT